MGEHLNGIQEARGSIPLTSTHKRREIPASDHAETHFNL